LQLALTGVLLPLASTPAFEAALPGDYGQGGLWQTPHARFADEGRFVAGVGATDPYRRLFISVQPFDWLETTFRYTDITNRLFSPDPAFSGDQSYKDRGFDLRVRLLEESARLPGLAVGVRDLSGTQLFASQFLVASRRWYDFDFSGGLGWGRMGSGGMLANPFARGQGRGDQSTSFIASEKIGVFGGVVWDSPLPGLQLLAEYDPNDFQNEPLDNPQRVRSPVNMGARYQLRSGALVGVSWQRGNTLGVTLALGVPLGTPQGVPKVLDRPPPPRREPPVAASTPAPWPERLKAALDQQRIAPEAAALTPDGSVAHLWVAPAPYRDSQKLIGRTVRAASSVLPESVREIRVTELNGGVPVYEARVPRAELDAAVQARQAGEATTAPLSVQPASPVGELLREVYTEDPRFAWSLNPALRSSIGGPDQFYFGQLWLKLGCSAQLAPGWSVDGQLGINLYNNFDGLRLESNSRLPRVRSDIKNYLQDGEQALVRLETNLVQPLAPTLYGRLSAGIFEEMYGGFAGELLYRPDNPRWALGVNVNHVRQRDFDQRLDFRDYRVTTGHVTGYFEWPQPSVLVKLSVGRYLARDVGATLDLSRQFPNGIRIGVFATRTDVSAEQFGEGSFDKGIYFVLPLDSMLPRSTPGSGAFLLRPLTRDGGQMVRDGRPLYDTTYGAVKARLPLRDGLFFE